MPLLADADEPGRRWLVPDLTFLAIARDVILAMEALTTTAHAVRAEHSHGARVGLEVIMLRLTSIYDTVAAVIAEQPDATFQIGGNGKPYGSA